MEKYGMAAPDDDDNIIDCYQQYVAQTGYRCELPDYSRTNYSGRPEWYSEEPRNCDPYERTDYRAPLTNRGGNLRNGL
ncbi:GH11281 [Drosophila grimshawi]|uniref:GH11281 n=2 Tax=Drosophila grimshawi TaxID=7222 RepID=B4JE01_DROGR|nr:GH11281 [Drosophila grimshawi]